MQRLTENQMRPILCKNRGGCSRLAEFKIVRTFIRRGVENRLEMLRCGYHALMYQDEHGAELEPIDG